MTKSNEIRENVNNSSVQSTSAHETCIQFIAYIRERYPELNSIKFMLRRKGTHLTLRARYHRRAIHADGRDFEKTMNCFMFHLIRKLSLEVYYPTKAEMKEKKPLEPFFVKFQCALIQNIDNNLKTS
jgi:hypothetical protein